MQYLNHVSVRWLIENNDSFIFIIIIIIKVRRSGDRGIERIKQLVVEVFHSMKGKRNADNLQ